MKQDAPLIVLQDVGKTYTEKQRSRTALEHISFSVNPGEFIAVTGRSGSGKTTLLNIIGGLDQNHDGKIFMAGADLAHLSDASLSILRNQKIGFIFQAFHLLPHLNIAENVALPARFSNQKNEGKTRSNALEALEKVSLASRAFDYPFQLSAGEKQRIAIARAIFNRPRLVLCDEPTGNLDFETGRLVLDIFLQLNREEQTTFIIATHEKTVSQAASRQIVLHQGRLVHGESS